MLRNKSHFVTLYCQEDLLPVIVKIFYAMIINRHNCQLWLLKRRTHVLNLFPYSLWDEPNISAPPFVVSDPLRNALQAPQSPLQLPRKWQIWGLFRSKKFCKSFGKFLPQEDVRIDVEQPGRRGKLPQFQGKTRSYQNVNRKRQQEIVGFRPDNAEIDAHF